MPTDLPRVLRESSLEPLRRELRAAGARVLVVEDACGLCRTRDGEPWDALWIQLESLDGVDLGSLERGVARALRPGGRLVSVVPGARSRSAAAAQPAAGSWRRAFEPSIEWRRSRALGLLVPPGAGWSRVHPLALALLAAVEEVVAGWPLLRGLGERVVHEGVRR